MTLITAPIAWLGRNATIMVALAVFIGLLWQDLAAALKPLLVPAILLPFIAALVRLEPARLLDAMPLKLLIPLMLWQLAGCALLIWAIGQLVPLASVQGYLITTAASAPLMASPAIAMLLGLNVPLAVGGTVFATLLLPLTLPPVVLSLAGLEIDLNAFDISLRLGSLIAVSIAIAWAVRWHFGLARLQAQSEIIAGLAVLGLAVFAIAIMDGAAALFNEAPRYVILCAVAAFALNAGLQAVTFALLTGFFGLRTALTMALLAGNNNIGIVLASTIDQASVEFAIYVAMAQFPIYLLPAIQRPIYRRWLKAHAQQH